MGYTYDTEENNGERWLILSDKEQAFPTEHLHVESIEERKTQAGKTMPVMTLVGTESGDKFQICAWKRDVKPCIEQYGNNPEQWDDVTFEKKNGRYQLVPAGLKAVAL